MPIYQYKCSECGHEIELFKKITDNSLPPVCPRCQQDALKKQISTATSFKLKGTGWYKTGA